MKVLAVDQSYTSCGIIVLEYIEDKEDYKIVHLERFVTNVETDMFARAWEVTQRIAELAMTCGVDYTALEGLAFAMAGNATRDLAGLQYVIVTALRYVEKQGVLVIPPNTVKKIATGKGNAKKEEMYEALPQEVKQMFEDAKLKKTTGRYDLTDAYWIARSAIEAKKTKK
jgi:Holliday junction resolvasome RuvABC endonuclease subunit